MDFKIFKSSITNVLNYFGILYLLNLLFDIAYSYSVSTVSILKQVEVKLVIFYILTVLFFLYFLYMIFKSNRKKEFQLTLIIFTGLILLLFWYYQ